MCPERAHAALQGAVKSLSTDAKPIGTRGKEEKKPNRTGGRVKRIAGKSVQILQK
jgi:hypothetical protein